VPHQPAKRHSPLTSSCGHTENGASSRTAAHFFFARPLPGPQGSACPGAPRVPSPQAWCRTGCQCFEIPGAPGPELHSGLVARPDLTAALSTPTASTIRATRGALSSMRMIPPRARLRRPAGGGLPSSEGGTLGVMSARLRVALWPRPPASPVLQETRVLAGARPRRESPLLCWLQPPPPCRTLIVDGPAPAGPSRSSPATRCVFANHIGRQSRP